MVGVSTTSCTLINASLSCIVLINPVQLSRVLLLMRQDAQLPQLPEYSLLKHLISKIRVPYFPDKIIKKNIILQRNSAEMQITFKISCGSESSN